MQVLKYTPPPPPAMKPEEAVCVMENKNVTIFF